MAGRAATSNCQDPFKLPCCAHPVTFSSHRTQSSPGLDNASEAQPITTDAPIIECMRFYCIFPFNITQTHICVRVRLEDMCTLQLHIGFSMVLLILSGSSVFFLHYPCEIYVLKYFNFLLRHSCTLFWWHSKQQASCGELQLRKLLTKYGSTVVCS